METGECNLGQFWFYYELHTSGRRIRINNAFKYQNIFPNRNFRDPVPLSALFKWKVGDWFNQTNDLYQPIVTIFLS